MPVGSRSTATRPGACLPPRATLVVMTAHEVSSLDKQRLVRVSKYLSKHLRHRPERLGLTLEPGGWVSVPALLTACRRSGFPVSLRELEEVVQRNDKRRFSFDDEHRRIRANQGHSVDVDLQLAPVTPPETLFHGTSARTVSQIWREGLLPMGRHHVHLSKDVHTATRVGARRGEPVVLTIEAGRMAADGHDFYESDNGVWLVAAVPPGYLSEPGGSTIKDR